MGLMDKVKAQATQVAAKAQEAGKAGQAKLEAVQAKRKADSMLEELGRISFESHVGRSSPGDERRASELVEHLRQYEAEYGPVGSEPSLDGPDDAGSPPASGGSFIPESSSGEGSL